ncbi:MAG: PEGA domain-containing protein [Patescibacteria group bacterium]
MTRKTRRILFTAAVAVFLMAGLVVTLYAQGYRWDFKTNRFLLAGGIYLKSKPKDARVFLNGKDLGQHTPYLIKNLLPLRQYKVKITKPGYQSWEKEFNIEPGYVVEAENIFLFPDKLNSQIIWNDAELKDFSISPDEKWLALKTSANQLALAQLSNTNATATPISFGDKRRTTEIELLENGRGWSANSKKFIFQRRLGTNQTLWYLWDTESSKLINLTAAYERDIVLKTPATAPLPSKFTASKVMWFGNDNTLAALISNQLFQIDLEKSGLVDLKMSEVIDFDIFDGKIIALKKPDILLALDSNVQNVTAIAQLKFGPQKVLFSTEGARVAYYNNQKLGVIWLKEITKQPQRQLNDQEIILENKNVLANVYWHAIEEHIVYLESGQMQTAELDGRSNRNTAVWPEKITAFNYLASLEKLYMLEGEQIRVFPDKF